MDLIRRNIYLLILVGLLILLLSIAFRALSPIILNLGYNVLPENEQPTSHADPEGWLNILWKPSALSAVAMAIFSILLWRVSVQQKKLLEKSTTVAEQALEEARESVRLTKAATEQTKRSVDAQIESARGSVILQEFQVRAFDGAYGFALRNIGGSPAIIIGMGVSPHTSYQLIDSRKAFVNIEMFYPLMPNEVYTWEYNKPPGVLEPLHGTPGTLWGPHEKRPDGSRLIEVVVHYTSIGSEFIFRGVVEVPPNVAYTRIIPDKRYTRDELITKENAPDLPFHYGRGANKRNT